MIEASTVTYAQYNEDLILSALFHDVDKGFYIDVGANDPAADSVTKFFYDRGWNGINVEPIKSLHKLLAKERPRDINLQCGAGRKSGRATLREYVGLSGHSTFDERQKKGYGKTGKYKDYEVSIRTLKNIFQEYAPAHVHFIKIDVEGYEYEVIAGNDWSKYRPEVVCVEANHVTHDWRTLINNKNYLFFIADGLNEYYVAKESWSRTENFAERIVQLDHDALKPHQAAAWSKDYEELLETRKMLDQHSKHIEALEDRTKRLEVLAPLSLRGVPLRSRIKRAAYGLTIDWIRFKKGR